MKLMYTMIDTMIDSFEVMFLIENNKVLLIFIIKITLLIANRPSVFLQHKKINKTSHLITSNQGQMTIL